MNTAVLLIVFNRPDPTQQVFSAIRAARPPRLYVAADGPRESRPAEAAVVETVRRIATAVDWPCEVHRLFRERNLGCKRAVSSAIDWFFDQEAEGIILEDDVLPRDGFFRFCETLLERHRDDPAISMISGCSFIGQPSGHDAGYLYTRYHHIWGWASWRRAWRHYDVDMAGWPGEGARRQLNRVLQSRKDAVAYWSTVFDKVAAGGIDTWDYQWLYSAWMADMTAIMPPGMLVENIGFGNDATHTASAAPSVVVNAPPARISFPLIHPPRTDTSAVDVLVERTAYGLTLPMKLRRMLRDVPLLGDALSRIRHMAGARA